jgi:hypothetical protein
VPFLPLLTSTLAAFAIGTTEFAVQGLLPEISKALGVSIPPTGLLVTGYALRVAFGGPILTIASKPPAPQDGLVVAARYFFKSASSGCFRLERLPGGLAPTGKRRPIIAHTPSGRSRPRHWTPQLGGKRLRGTSRELPESGRLQPSPARSNLRRSLETTNRCRL